MSTTRLVLTRMTQTFRFLPADLNPTREHHHGAGRRAHLDHLEHAALDVRVVDGAECERPERIRLALNGTSNKTSIY